MKQYENIPEMVYLLSQTRIRNRWKYGKKEENFFKKKISGLMQKKLVMLFGVIILAFVFLIGGLLISMLRRAKNIPKIVLDQQQYNNRTIPFKRGDIVDRNGTKLATSERVYNVVVDAKGHNSNKKYVESDSKGVGRVFRFEEESGTDSGEEESEQPVSCPEKGSQYAKAQEFEKITADTKNNPNVQGVWLEEDYTENIRINTGK